MWVLRFGNGVTSAGVAVEDWLAEDLRLADGEPAWRRLLARYPSIAAQFADARPIRAFTWMPRLAYRAATAAGERWAMLPSAAAFVDPLFSTGHSADAARHRAAREHVWSGGSAFDFAQAQERPASTVTRRSPRPITRRGSSPAATRLSRFPMFTAYSMFYFAAASFSEMARRLARRARRAAFCAATATRSRARWTRLSPAARWPVTRDSTTREVAAAVADWNIAGLCDRGEAELVRRRSRGHVRSRREARV